MRYVSVKSAPAYACDVILKQEGDNYRIMKNVQEASTIESLIEESECQKYLDAPIKVCIYMNDGYKIYNFNPRKRPYGSA